MSRQLCTGAALRRALSRASQTAFAAAGLLLLASGLRAASTDWPEFRGPGGDGHAGAASLPLHWSETNNVRWKSEIPLFGWSTPVIMGGQVWMTSATADGHDFYAICVNADTGKIIYNEKVFHSDNPEPLGNGASMNCYATPSPAIEPGRVYVHFGSFVICVEAATGQSVWASRLGGNFESSPIYAGGRLYFFNQQGVTTVLKPGRACDILATNKLDDLFMASPAVSGESLFLRGKTRLYRVEDPPPTSKPSP